MENYFAIDFKKVGVRIRTARKAHKLTQVEAAEICFITGQYWSAIESGRKRASVNTYRQIAAILGLTLDDIFYDDANTMRVRRGYTEGGVFADCTDDEKTIISEMLLALKEILERNRRRP